MQRAGRSTLILFLAGAAFFIDVFLDWTRVGGGQTGNVNGWQIQLVNQAGLIALALALVELARIRALWLTPTSALLGCLLGAAAAVLAVGGLANMHWGNYVGLKFSRYGYGAWIGLAIAAALLYGAWLRLSEDRVSATA